MDQFCVVIFEPAIKGETLMAAEQIHEIVGPFNDADEADEWLKTFQNRAAVSAEHAKYPSHFEYYISSVREPF